MSAGGKDHLVGTGSLSAKHILVTRSRHQAGELTERLRALSARVTEIPTIELKPPRSFCPLDRAILHLEKFSWLIFTSMNGVDAFFERLGHHKIEARILKSMPIAAIGPATARRLERWGKKPNVVADSYRAEGLVKKLMSRVTDRDSVLIPRAEKARMVLPDELRKKGAKVTLVSCYRSVIPSGSREALKKLIRNDPPDLLTFASSSMVMNFAAILKKDKVLWRRARKIPAACIGPVTAKTAKEEGLKIIIQPKCYTIPDLVDAIRRYAKKLKA